MFNNQVKTLTKLLSDGVLNLIKMLHGGGIAKFLRFISSQPLAFAARKQKNGKGVLLRA